MKTNQQSRFFHGMENFFASCRSVRRALSLAPPAAKRYRPRVRPAPAGLGSALGYFPQYGKHFRGSSTVWKTAAAVALAAAGLALPVEALAQQVGTSISADGALPNANAMLDIQSPAAGDGKGLLIPRVTQAQRTTADGSLAGGLLDGSGDLRGGAAHGLMVYQTDGAQGFYYNYSGTAAPMWMRVGNFQSDGSVAMTGPLNLGGNVLTNVQSIDMSTYDVQIGEGALSYSSSAGSVAVGRSATARYRVGGVAVGMEADGDYNGIAIGYQSDGQYSNIAIGYAASAYSGYDRIAMGRGITNRRNDSMAIRGSLYLDGGTGVMFRSTVGVGDWTAKAFTIDHPTDPENQVLRHFAVEGPVVWNLYAGRGQLINGEATVDLPDYYSALNRVGAEVYSLTPIGAPSALYVKQEVADNRFIVGGDADTVFSWTIHVPRNDAALLEDLKQRPVEQRKDELRPGRAARENRAVNTDVSTP